MAYHSVNLPFKNKLAMTLKGKKEKNIYDEMAVRRCLYHINVGNSIAIYIR